jgi:hypothetical protein
VDPDSNKTFSNLLDLTAPMLSTTMMVTGVKFLFGGLSGILFLFLFSAINLRFSIYMVSHIALIYNQAFECIPSGKC